MTVGIYRAANAMDGARRRLEVVANNIANTSTPAYRRRLTAFHQHLAERTDTDERVIADRMTVDLRQGRIEDTGRPLDLALTGGGYFAIEKPEGEVYTRNGSFRIDENGALVTQEDHPVAWAERAGVLDPLGQPITVNDEGTVFQGQDEVGTLRLANFEDARRLEIGADGYLVRPQGLREVAHEAEVHQGALEASNVEPTEELIALIQIQRAYEGAARAMSAIEQTYSRLHRQTR